MPTLMLWHLLGFVCTGVPMRQSKRLTAKGLCAEFPARLRKCMENEGERLAK